MKSVSWDGVQLAGTALTGGSTVSSGSWCTAGRRGCRVLTGNPAAAMAAGLVDVWSTTRLLTTRGSVSKTLPFFCA